jgi:phosphoserine phosphatase
MPFGPVHKRTEASVRDASGKEYKVTKGAPQVITALDPGAAEFQDRTEKAIMDFAARGFRSLGVARTGDDGRWRFLGVIPLYDPLREDSGRTIEAAGKLGLKVKMLTGDQVAIAKEIARQLGLGQNIMDAGVFGETRPHEGGRLADSIEEADGFAQVFPEHKYHIVDVLQQRGHIVGMTGDGVNDAPALKKADAGIAVSGATDATRSAASIALLTPGLSVIIDAIRESRRILAHAQLRHLPHRRDHRASGVPHHRHRGLSPLPGDRDYDRVPGHPERWVDPVDRLRQHALGPGPAALGHALRHGPGRASRRLRHRPLAGHVWDQLGPASNGPGGSADHDLPEPVRRRHFHAVRGAHARTVLVREAQAAPALHHARRTIIATLISVYGFLVVPIGWTDAGIVWGYCLVMFLLQDRVKLAGRRIFREEHSGYFGRHAR